MSRRSVVGTTALGVVAAPTANPAQLAVEPLGDAWTLADGNHSLRLFDTEAEASDGLKVARNWTQLCFIGRGNDRPNPAQYVMQHWRS